MIYFTSDCHFYHKNIIDLCRRPFTSLDEMHQVLIQNWNDVVKSDDTVYVLGDFCFGGTKHKVEILSQLSGYKILIKGNHDDRSHKMLKAGFDECHYELLTTLPEFGKVRMSHYPYGPESSFEKLLYRMKGFDLRYLERRPKNSGEILLHGHVHNKWIRYKNQINVGVDVWDYKPVSLTALIAFRNASERS